MKTLTGEDKAAIALTAANTKLYHANQKILTLQGEIQYLRKHMDMQAKAFAQATELQHVAVSQMRAQVLTNA